ATHDVRRAGVKAGDTVLVFGGGPIGTLIAMVCRERGARVAVAEVNRFRIEMLQNLGRPTTAPDAGGVKFANDWTGGVGVDVAFEVPGHPAAVRAATDVVRVSGGKWSPAGIRQSPVTRGETECARSAVAAGQTPDPVRRGPAAVARGRNRERSREGTSATCTRDRRRRSVLRRAPAAGLVSEA